MATKISLVQKVYFKTIQHSATADDNENFSAAILRVSELLNELKFKPRVLHFASLSPPFSNPYDGGDDCDGDGDGDGESIEYLTYTHRYTLTEYYSCDEQIKLQKSNKVPCKLQTRIVK